MSSILPSPPPDASATQRGLVNLLAQSFTGVKTFANNVVSNGYFNSSVSGSSATAFYASGAVSGAFQALSTFKALTSVADGSSANGFVFNTTNTLADPTATLFDFQNNGTSLLKLLAHNSYGVGRLVMPALSGLQIGSAVLSNYSSSWYFGSTEAADGGLLRAGAFYLDGGGNGLSSTGLYGNGSVLQPSIIGGGASPIVASTLTGASSKCTYIGATSADGSVSAGAKLVSFGTGLGVGETKVEKAFIDRDGSATFAAIELGATGRIRWGGGNYISNNGATGCLTNTSGYESSIASGSDAFKMLDGARVNFSTADSACYMWRGAANEIHSAAFLVADGANSGFWDKYGNGYYVDAGGTKRLHYTGTQIAVNGSFVIENGGMDVASAQDIRMRDGGKLNLSTGDANAYFARTAANLINTPGKLTTTAGLGVGNSASATVAVGVLAKKIEVFDASGSSLGFIPVYATIT